MPATVFPNALDDFSNPISSTPLTGGGNEALRHSIQHTQNNDAIEAIEAKVGTDWSNDIDSLDFKVRIAQAISCAMENGGFEETTGFPFPSNVTWYVDNTKAIKTLEADISYGPGTKKFVTQIIYRLYDGTISNILKRTITDVYTRNGPFKTTKTRTIT